jgi:lipid II:glycine glycyltransferase (peptidoglycan interpeptide bridge formation enzyme)
MIHLAKASDLKAWNGFLEEEKERQLVTIAHNPSLGRILAKTFGYKEENMFIMKDDQIIGVLPAVKVGKKLVSMPHFSYGGPIFCSKSKENLEVSNLLNETSFEVRGLQKVTDNFYANKIVSKVKLKNCPEEQFMNISSSARRKIRQARKRNFQTVHGGLELLDDFYKVYSKRMFQKGSPPLGKNFFRNLLEDYEHGKAQISAIYSNGNVAAAGLTLCYKDFNELCWVSSDKKYDRYNVNSLLYWNIIKDSIANGYCYFSMGRSTVNSTNHRFKKQWNPIELPLFFNHSHSVGKSIKEFTFLTKLWKLQPFKTSVLFGKYISKYVY